MITPADRVRAANEPQDLVDPASIEPEKPLRLYSARQVSGAAFFGGSIAGGWLLALNFARTRNPKAALNAMLAAVVVLAPLTALVLFLPSDFPGIKMILPFLTAILFQVGYRIFFAAKYSEHVDSGASKASLWKAAGVTLAAIPVSTILFVVFAVFIPVTAMNQLIIYDNSIYYEGRATRSDAEQLGEFLTNQGFLYDGAFLDVVVDFPKNQIDDVIIKADIERPTEGSETYLAIVQLLQTAEQELYRDKQVSFEVTNLFGTTVMHIQVNAMIRESQVDEMVRGRSPYDTSAAESLLNAAEGGDPDAQLALGHAYLNGDGLPQDYAEARYWFQEAAYQGLAEAQFTIGMMHLEGSAGGLQDSRLGYAWLGAAAAQSDEDAKTEMEIVGDRLNRRELAEAQRLLERFVTNYVEPYR